MEELKYIDVSSYKLENKQLTVYLPAHKALEDYIEQDWYRLGTFTPNHDCIRMAYSGDEFQVSFRISL